jgi:hypothetical protein
VELISEARENMNKLAIGEISRETKSGSLIVNRGKSGKEMLVTPN